MAVLAAAVLASGCAGQGKEDAAASDTVEAPEESSNAEATEIIGMVKEISDSQISLVTGRPGPRGGGQGKGDAGKGWTGKRLTADLMRQAQTVSRTPKKPETGRKRGQEADLAGEIRAVKREKAGTRMRPEAGARTNTQGMAKIPPPL